MTDREAMQMALEIIGTHHGSFKHEITTLREVMEMALEIIETHPGDYENQIIAIRAKLEQQIHTSPADTHQLNTPAQRQWSSLTDDEIKEVIGPWGEAQINGYTRKLFDKIDEALRKKNHD